MSFYKGVLRFSAATGTHSHGEKINAVCSSRLVKVVVNDYDVYLCSDNSRLNGQN